MKAWQQDVNEAVASLVAQVVADNGAIPVGHAGTIDIVHLSHDEATHETILRTSDGGAWVMRIVQLGKHMQFSGGDDATKVRYSYAKYQELVEQKRWAMRLTKSLGIEDENLALQSFYEDVLNDASRAHWDRWSPGGYATDDEWKMATGRSPRPAEDNAPTLPRVDADEMS